MIKESMLHLLDHKLSYEVHTDTLDYAVEGVLMQEVHPITYESWKFNDVHNPWERDESHGTLS